MVYTVIVIGAHAGCQVHYSNSIVAATVSLMLSLRACLCLYLYRMAVFHFVIDDQIEEPIVEFVSEKPFLQYVSMTNIILCETLCNDTSISDRIATLVHNN